MDDVLDSVRAVHVHGDVYRRVPVMVPVLLRGEDRAGAVAAVAGDKGLLHTVQEVRSPGAVQAGTGMKTEVYCTRLCVYRLTNDVNLILTYITNSPH